ncbi:unnamed protein product [Mesocestoides corti]|uniref:Secreted protein n=1 Tax=Mesocestoides corti TaxID=53468 RepID=A0A0R3UHQ2_MESCO|nr:unnamed protein product [Mesocestoides corti]
MGLPVLFRGILKTPHMLRKSNPPAAVPSTSPTHLHQLSLYSCCIPFGSRGYLVSDYTGFCVVRPITTSEAVANPDCHDDRGFSF